MGITIGSVGNGYPMPELPADHGPTPSAVAIHPVEHQSTDTASTQDLNTTVAQLEKVTSALNRKLSFKVDRDLNEVIVKVIDPQTDKVIREIPSKELQNLHLKIKEMIGILFDKTV